MTQDTTAILILAAGASTRMGSPKQLLAWGNLNLLQNAIAQAEESKANAMLVVLGANAESIQKTIPEHVAIVENSDWETGMGSSIACGMRFFLQSETAYSAILIILADQPLLDAEYLNQMISAAANESKGIIATAYHEKAGVPALFDKKYFQQLEQLSAAFGAKALLAQNSGDIHLLNAGLKTTDIDTKEDYKNLNKLNK